MADIFEPIQFRAHKRPRDRIFLRPHHGFCTLELVSDSLQRLPTIDGQIPLARRCLRDQTGRESVGNEETARTAFSRWAHSVPCRTTGSVADYDRTTALTGTDRYHISRSSSDAPLEATLLRLEKGCYPPAGFTLRL